MGISLQDWKNVSLMLMKVSLQGLTRVEVNINTKTFKKYFFPGHICRVNTCLSFGLFISQIHVLHYRIGQ